MNAAAATPMVAAALLAMVATGALMRWRARLPVATPNERTLHAAPIPRVGGIALWVGWLPMALLAPTSPSMAISIWGAPWLALCIVSLVDDIRGVQILPRLAVHALATLSFAVLIAGRGTPVASALAIAVIALIAAWSLNLYNFMDGSDGLAASMSIVGFGACGAVLLHKSLPATLPLALAAAMLPVFTVNWPPARMFLGDVGAVPLGFLAAAIGIGGVVDGAWPPWFPVLVFLPFIADASVTLLRRAISGERFWEGHKSHYYQRLNRMGAGHGGTLAVFGALMLGTAGTAVACACLRPGWGNHALAAWCAVCAVLFAAIDYHWRRFEQRT